MQPVAHHNVRSWPKCGQQFISLETEHDTMIWANLLHLSYNMWKDTPGDTPTSFSPDLRCDQAIWDELTERMAQAGFTMLVIDLGDAVRYESHPEIAVNGAWSTEKLRRELARLRELGLEPIPKLNFSACHDAWLREYSRQVSTEVYYRVCAELIAEVAQLFDTPRFFHLGMDEESAGYQRTLQYAVMRQHDLWWHDLSYLVDETAKSGSRPWVWSDHAWRVPEEYYGRMPQSVVQSNWYYGTTFTDSDQKRPRPLGRDEFHLAYLDLDEHGYDQIPTGSNWTVPENFELTVEYCTRELNPARLLGFLQTPWKSTEPVNRDHHLQAIDVVARAIGSGSVN